MKNKTCLGLALASLLSSVAVATADTTTTYQTLLNAYNSATQPAAYSDFGTQTISPLTCVVVLSSAPTQVDGTQIGTETYTITPAVAATPAYGPLIPATPGTPAVTKPIVVMGESPDQLDQQTLALFSDQITATDFVISVAKNNLGVYSDVGDNVQILIRKSGTMFPFLLNNSSTTMGAGYCY